MSKDHPFKQLVAQTDEETMSWQAVVGFEVHVELATVSKMFCGCPADHFGKPPNTQTCPVCLGLPGALPVPNATAIKWCIKLGLALNCQINLHSKFDRKNYFYPDLPKGYQITQYDMPFCHGGSLLGHKITRVHLEEDTGKLLHQGNETLIDYNRSGVPLVEIVTEPDFDNSDTGIEFLKEIQAIVRTLGISTADMEKGSLRLEANVSVRLANSPNLPNYKVEIKNVNSFRFVKKAIDFEIARQVKLIESGTVPVQETRGFDEATGETVGQRGKEEAHDYRYFPEPDIPPLQFTKEQIEEWRSELPELPQQLRQRLVFDYTLTLDVASILVANTARYKKFMNLASQNVDYQSVANLVVNTPEDQLSDASMHQTQVIRDESLIKQTAREVIAANPQAIADYKSGKSQAISYLVGQVKRQLPGVDVPLAKRIIEGLIKPI